MRKLYALGKKKLGPVLLLWEKINDIEVKQEFICLWKYQKDSESTNGDTKVHLVKALKLNSKLVIGFSWKFI